MQCLGTLLWLALVGWCIQQASAGNWVAAIGAFVLGSGVITVMFFPRQQDW